jgi:hypothetical protein
MSPSGGSAYFSACLTGFLNPRNRFIWNMFLDAFP